MTNLDTAVQSAVSVWDAWRQERNQNRAEENHREFRQKLVSVIDHLFIESENENVPHQRILDAFGPRFHNDSQQLMDVLIEAGYISERAPDGAYYWSRMPERPPPENRRKKRQNGPGPLAIAASIATIIAGLIALDQYFFFTCGAACEYSKKFQEWWTCER